MSEARNPYTVLVNEAKKHKSYWREAAKIEVACAINYAILNVRKSDNKNTVHIKFGIRDISDLGYKELERILRGDGENITLDTLSDIAFALGCRVIVKLEAIDKMNATQENYEKT